jgi:hypothetical protein
LVPALAVEGRVVFPEAYVRSRDHLAAIVRGPGLFVRSDVGADGGFLVEGLPPGTWQLCVQSIEFMPVLRDVEAGTEVEIDMR